MKNNLIENDKIKTSLINQLKLNRKSIEILKPLNLIKKSDLFNIITTRKDNSKKKTFNKKYNFNSKLFASNNKLSIKLDSESDISIKNINTNEEFKSLPILSERSNEKIKNKIKKLSLKFSLNSLNKNTNKNKNLKMPQTKIKSTYQEIAIYQILIRCIFPRVEPQVKII